MALGVGSGALLFNVDARQAVTQFLGLRQSHLAVDIFEISPGLNSLGQQKRPERTDQVREALTYPAFYGALVGITSELSNDGPRTVLWFQGANGTIRNAVEAQASERLLSIDPLQHRKLSRDWVRGSER